jgi:hypothetical protein
MFVFRRRCGTMVYDGAVRECRLTTCRSPLVGRPRNMFDAPEKLPENIATLRVGSVISGECSVCYGVVVVEGIGSEHLPES